eukprot:CAMPEP_0119403054 /NCGR_PEP_ID=MMETSP1334-20130426/143192_1 /TAXON_ID=127549 /ORGANISM="Calcidiscus leptoporus, Strain RCC1130" /LENGTH=82 /DNA_ID=CAMNT_0007426993 /DNA_START=429 /DNA_END=677 /DNA_ORIENTATION=-
MSSAETMTSPPLRVIVIVLSVIELVRLTSRKDVMFTKKPEQPDAMNINGCWSIRAKEPRRSARGNSVTNAAGTIHSKQTGLV